MKFIAFILAVLGLIASNANAQLICYEGFNYTPGTKLNGIGTGTGWAAAWVTAPAFVTANKDNATAVTSLKPGGLAFTGQRLQTVGNDVRSFRRIDTTAGSGAAAAGLVNANGKIGVPNGIVWVSYMAALSSGNNTNTGNGGFHLYDGLGDLNAFTDGDKGHHEILFLGDRNNPTTGINWCVEVTSGGSGTVDSTVPVNTTPHLFVWKLEMFAGRNGRVTLYIDPAIGAASATLTPTFVTNVVTGSNVQTQFQFDYVEIGSANSNGASPYQERLDIDEFRIGATYASVTPAVALPAPVLPPPVKQSNGAMLLNWQTTDGFRYAIDYSGDLSLWSPAITPTLASGNPMSWTDDGSVTGTTPSLAMRRFYRLYVQE